ncbi:hypothetical protein IV203_026820 [Nitzschia inconspicua]|uniref:Uncharacterized protein n=1 Tax=Nitzschia inconspicua TaxID=303405 RepID=A0A9K3PXV9_9STRA|nr:hypothetical protein IV203_026820 [Nitzschia inconspicua]
MTFVLSPLAKPFHPTMGQDVNSIIYNDGVPSLSFQGSPSQFLHTIQDDALDEAFPPNAEDAAELEAVEVFVEMMAALSYLEEKEEAARALHSGLKKRWEARRELVGRPKQARHLVKPVVHAQPNAAGSMDLVAFDQSHVLQEHRMLQRENARIAKQAMPKKSNNKMVVMQHQHKPIQQPRKQN